MAEGKIVKLAEQEAYAAKGHTNTHAWRIISKETVGAELVRVGLVEIRPGGEAQEDAHPGTEQAYYILSGEAEGFVGDLKFVVKANECVWIPPGVKHYMKTRGMQTLQFIVVTTDGPAQK
jgi:mannose-6-phosphate isomerase-like protein (cupin superfamily)